MKAYTVNTYRLPSHTTPEMLAEDWATVLLYGDKVIMAGYYYNGVGCPSYFGAVYEFLTDDTTCEGEIALQAASELIFEDNGHAIEWAITHLWKRG